MININEIDFKKSDGLVPCIVQDAQTLQVLMLGYMNEEAFSQTIESKKVTFYSRTKHRLWTKGEESGNFLNLVSIELDCDKDSLLCLVNPIGPTCHTGSKTCWNNENKTSFAILEDLEKTIQERFDKEPENSYISSLKQKGINKIAQKVGEEGVEVVIEALGNDKELFLNESADLLFHYLILLKAKDFALEDVLAILNQRKKS
ncbi:MAG: bifunctional phosphoribosyl-AMP cyclohydrolase/phosphoribosyl-ATP diphosphatase HisIE [Flavobacteriia bacterium]|jgi:phosphoribosyl-ATP pyrophosphohydrolase/phosphoribosyl-AMP cyclohydrolase